MLKMFHRQFWASISESFRAGAAQQRSSGRAGWPWTVVRVDRDTRRPVAWGLPGRTLWYAWCDCGWSTVRRRRRAAAVCLANHAHLPPR